ncbi:MAG: sirohydrochlorin cobaltochelatase [Hespellia sp.]|nr:sirohydrochlorin cobaltochelatase [Hespellia sp.]
MQTESKKAILIVSFGTTHNDTRAVTIDAIEQAAREAFPQYQIYRGWTSKMIISRLKKRDNIHIPTVSEAMAAMSKDGITDVIVQLTHIINGIENEQMIADALAFQKSFHSIRFGNPLLTTTQDHHKAIRAIAHEFPDLPADTALVLMGHGTTHFANSVYAALDYTFKDLGYSNIFLGTVEAYPSMESLIKMVKSYGAKKIILAPFMIVAGDHAKNDMSGEDEDSWYYQFKQAGYDVKCVLKGLGEYPEIRDLLMEHISDVI